MKAGNWKTVMSASAISPVGGHPDGIYLLYALGDEGMDYERLQAVVEKVPYFPLGSACWLVKLQGSEVLNFSNEASYALPEAESKAELLLFYLAPHSAIVHGNADGLGLKNWLRKHG